MRTVACGSLLRASRIRVAARQLAFHALLVEAVVPTLAVIARTDRVSAPGIEQRLVEQRPQRHLLRGVDGGEHVVRVTRAGATPFVQTLAVRARGATQTSAFVVDGEVPAQATLADGRRVHKTVHHYLLLATDPVHGLELSDEDVEVSEVAWVPLDELPSRLAYADERRLLERVPDLLAETA